MRRTFAAALAAHVVGAAWLAAASFNPRIAGAQQWAALAFSPTKMATGEAHGPQSQAVVVNTALQSCAEFAKDCRLLGSTMSGCLAVAMAPVGNSTANHYGYAAGATRDAAAANAIAACTRAGVAACYVPADPCAGDDPRGPSPLPLPPTPPGPALVVDRGLVGIWQATVPGGIWLWQIAANGTYTFRGEATTNEAPSHVGTFTASNGKYTLHAYNIRWDDQGTYTAQPGGDAVVFSGKLGTGTWTRVKSNAPAGPVPGVNIRK